jgi:E3 ubiquitin-protein ligase ZNF598
MDLQGHMVEEHGADMSSRDRKQFSRVEAGFEFSDINLNNRTGNANRREREREPPPAPPPQAARQQQQQALVLGPSTSSRPPGAGPAPPGAGNRRREAFGASLTDASGQPAASAGSSRGPSRTDTPLGFSTPGTSTPSGPRADVDPQTME